MSYYSSENSYEDSYIRHIHSRPTELDHKIRKAVLRAKTTEETVKKTIESCNEWVEAYRDAERALRHRTRDATTRAEGDLKVHLEGIHMEYGRLHTAEKAQTLRTLRHQKYKVEGNLRQPEDAEDDEGTTARPSITQREPPDDCTICMDALTESTKAKALPCGHDVFHFTCLNRWLESGVGREVCPLCKRGVREVRYDGDKVYRPSRRYYQELRGRPAPVNYRDWTIPTESSSDNCTDWCACTNNDRARREGLRYWRKRGEWLDRKNEILSKCGQDIKRDAERLGFMVEPLVDVFDSLEGVQQVSAPPAGPWCCRMLTLDLKVSPDIQGYAIRCIQRLIHRLQTMSSEVEARTYTTLRHDEPSQDPGPSTSTAISRNNGNHQALTGQETYYELQRRGIHATVIWNGEDFQLVH